MPERYGPSTTCCDRFVRWRKAGVWDRLLAAVSAAFEGGIVMVDSTCVRVHQHGATGKIGGPEITAWDVPEAASRARPMPSLTPMVVPALRLTGGRADDSQEAQALLEAMPEGAHCLVTRGPTATPPVKLPPPGTRGPTSRHGPTASDGSPSRAGSIGSAIWSNAFSIGSGTSEASPRATTRAPKTASPP